MNKKPLSEDPLMYEHALAFHRAALQKLITDGVRNYGKPVELIDVQCLYTIVNANWNLFDRALNHDPFCQSFYKLPIMYHQGIIPMYNDQDEPMRIVRIFLDTDGLLKCDVYDWQNRMEYPGRLLADTINTPDRALGVYKLLYEQIEIARIHQSVNTMLNEIFGDEPDDYVPNPEEND